MGIKAKEIFENALALNVLNYNFKEPYKEHCIIDMINEILSQTFIYNNLKRIIKGKKKMNKTPFIKDIDDKIDFEIEFYAPLSYGLASLVARDLGDIRLANLYKQQFDILCKMV